jgi:hypothetical protein
VNEGEMIEVGVNEDDGVEIWRSMLLIAKCTWQRPLA